MPSVYLSVMIPPAFNDAFAATWSILDEQLLQVAQGSFLGVPNAEAVLDPGTYYARLRLPNNRMETRRFEMVAERYTKVEFALDVDSEHEWLSWTTVGESAAMLASAVKSPLLQDVWVRAWSFQQGEWKPQDDALSGQFNSDGRRMQLELRAKSNHLFAVQVGGEKIAPRFVVLPPGNTARLLITAHPDRKNTQAHQLELTVSLANSVADYLARYLATGDLSSTMGLKASLAEQQGRDLLLKKCNDPLGAAVGAYFLVGRTAPAPINWLRNLADIDWLADGAVVCAYALLKTPSTEAIAEARTRLLAAAARGYPVFRIGLEWFLDAHRLLRSSDESDAALDAAAALYSSARQHTTRQTLFTSFFGESPATPGRSQSNLESALTGFIETGMSSQLSSQQWGVRVLSSN